MITANEMKTNIINLISGIDDVDTLGEIYESFMEKVMPSTASQDEVVITQKPKLSDAIIEIREGVTLKQLQKEQNYQPITYEEFRELADQIEWEHSLEELLAALD